LHNADASALVDKLREGINRHPDNIPAVANAKKIIEAVSEIYGISPDADQ